MKGREFYIKVIIQNIQTPMISYTVALKKNVKNDASNKRQHKTMELNLLMSNLMSLCPGCGHGHLLLLIYNTCSTNLNEILWMQIILMVVLPNGFQSLHTWGAHPSLINPCLSRQEQCWSKFLQHGLPTSWYKQKKKTTHIT